MANLAKRFLQGLLWKTLFLGSIVAVICAAAISKTFAAWVLLGLLLNVTNLLVVGWVGQQITRAAQRGNTSTTRWSFLWALKIFLLFGLTYYVIVVMGADVLAFMLGYSMFLPAAAWQTAIYIARETRAPDSSEDTFDTDIERP